MIDKKHINDIISKNIKKYRVARGISQQGLADILKVSQQQVMKYENGKAMTPAARLGQIAKALNISASKFFQDE